MKGPSLLMRSGISVAVMCGGSLMVFGLMVGMNACQDKPKSQKTERTTKFAVAPKPPPPKKPKPKPKPRKRKARSTRTRATPPPSLGGGMAPPGFALPSFQAGQIQGQNNTLLGSGKSSVMTEDAVDSRPVPQRRVSAQYPPRARAKGVTGYVLMSILINERGQVERVKVLNASPSGVFEQVAREAIKRWTFQPAKYKGQPVKTWAKQRINFKLS